MSKFSKCTQTKQGQALAAKAIAGECKIIYTQLAIGDGSHNASEDVTNMTKLLSEKQRFDVCACSKDSNEVKVTAVISNDGLSQGYYIREIGLYAKSDISNATPILFSVTIIEEKPDFLSARDSGEACTEIIMNYTSKLSSTENIECVTPSNAYALKSDFEAFKATKAKQNGIATLDGTGKIPAEQIPAYAVSDIYYSEKHTLASFCSSDSQASTIQKSDIVVITDSNQAKLTYMLAEADGTDESNYISINQSKLPFGMITDKPTTLAGYGIGNAYTKNEVNGVVDGIQIGGRNLFLNTVSCENWSAGNKSNQVFKDIDNNLNYRKIYSSVTTSWVYYCGQKIKSTANKQMVASFLVRNNSSSDVELDARFDSSDDMALSSIIISASQTEWSRVYLKIKPNKSKVENPLIFFCHANCPANSSDTSLDIALVKVEDGQYATDFTEAPEDQAARESDMNDKILVASLGQYCNPDENGNTVGYRTGGQNVFGYRNKVISGYGANSNGYCNTASGEGANANGLNTYANGDGANSNGIGTKTWGDGTSVRGKWNVHNNGVPGTTSYADIVGGGTSDSERKNIYQLGWQGKAEYSDDVVANKDSDNPISLVALSNQVAQLVAQLNSNS